LRFILFISTFLTLYSAIHFYAFMKARKALSLGGGAAALLVLFMLVMVFSPVLVRLSENLGFERSARIMAYVGYTWMGILFLFVSASLFLDAVSLIGYAARAVTQKIPLILALSSRQGFLAALVAAVLAAGYGSFEAWRIRTEHVTIRTTKLPETQPPIRIAQISDVHLGLIVREARLGRILEKVKEASPDLLVSTGDLVDGQTDNLTRTVEMFREINPRLGKFAITGNHEFYAGLQLSVDFMKEAGFTVLRGEGVTVSETLNIAGVDDPAGRGFDAVKEGPEKEILSGLPRDKFTVLLKHRPVVSEGSPGLFDLQLSGHAHKGQIFPFTLLVRLFFPMISGSYDLPSGSFLYVSRGSGTWGPPIRFLSSPEVTVIDIVPE
jgi:predicted MPP superfamily phosphohydrolase